ncbi:MAG TPA: potassium-transporting ATPase subunit KdpA, partial [Chthonomonadaceae bacterium]|nr:potassium-transporting ATPase subunit KdpA [Chthonomonadaceae bacterium]
MNAVNLAQYLFFLLIVLALVKPLGRYMARVFAGEKTWLDPVLRPVERSVYRLMGVNEKHDMAWTDYLYAFLASSLVATLFL